MRERCEGQGKRRPHVDRHPLDIRHEPEEAIAEEQRRLVQDAQGEEPRGNSRAQSFQLLDREARTLVEGGPDDRAVYLQKNPGRHQDRNQGQRNDQDDTLPAGPGDKDVKRYRQSRGHDGGFFGHDREHIEKQGQAQPVVPLADKASYPCDARQHDEQGGHDDRALHQVRDCVHGNRVQCEQHDPNPQRGLRRWHEISVRLDLLRETLTAQQLREQAVQAQGHAKVQDHIDQALSPPAVAYQRFQPDETAVRQHPGTQLQDISENAEDRAIRQASVVEDQFVAERWEVDRDRHSDQQQDEDQRGRSPRHAVAHASRRGWFCLR